MTDAIQLLQGLGLGEYEARAYQALLQHNPVTGYELAKVSGIPRPNIYPVLQRLEERGLVLRQVGDTTRFLPIPPQEFLDRLNREFNNTLADARQILPALAHVVERHDVWSAEGYTNVLNLARTLVDGAERELLVAVWPQEARQLVDQMQGAEARGVEITTLCMAACAQECGGCRGYIQRSTVADTQGARWLLLVPDAKEALAGEIPALGEPSVVRTRQHLFVSLATWFIRHSIALAALLRDFGPYLEARVQEPARVALSAAGPRGSGGWLAHMRRLLRSPGGNVQG